MCTLSSTLLAEAVDRARCFASLVCCPQAWPSFLQVQGLNIVATAAKYLFEGGLTVGGLMVAIIAMLGTHQCSDCQH